MEQLPTPQLVNTFRLAVALKVAGTLFAMLLGYLVARDWIIQRWWLALVLGMILGLILTPWQHLARNGWRGWLHTIPHWQLILALTLAVVAPQIELIQASYILPHTDPIRWRVLGWSQEQINSVHALGGLFMMAPVVLASWQYGWKGFILTLIWSGVWYVLTPLALPRDAFTWVLYAIRGFVQLGVTLIVGGIVSILVTAQRQQQVQLETANRQLAQQAVVREQLAASQERNRLARELHDTLAHSLSGTAVQLQAVRTLLKVNPDAAAEQLLSAQHSLKQGLEESRRAIAALRATPLEEQGFLSALLERANQIGQRARFAVHCKISTLPTLPAPIEQTIYRIMDEALVNVERHAQASQVKVNLTKQGRSLVLTVEDDGVGFVVEEGKKRGRYGLIGMQERAELMGGQLQIDSATGQGTTLHLIIPLP